MKLNKHSLDEFVATSDNLGGPQTAECAAYWSSLQYEPSFVFDAQDEPFSVRYYAQQMRLYEEITGHSYLDVRDEFTPGVPVTRLVNAPNAYDHPLPAEYAKHCVAMGLLIKELGLPRGARILELGSGWGFCQEFLSQCGFITVGIDTNPDFVASSNARLERLGFGRPVIQCTFEQITVDKVGQFDAIIAYEAFHHAVNPHVVLKQAMQCLKPEGIFALAAEPFNDYYRSWGLRLDSYSIYCIKKFGWFESGWSVEYMADLFGRVGLEASFIDAGISELTRFMLGRPSNRRKAFQLKTWPKDKRNDFFVDNTHICSKGDSVLTLRIPKYTSQIKINFVNFNNAPLTVRFDFDGKKTSSKFLPGPGTLIWNTASFDKEIEKNLQIKSEMFSPLLRGINLDNRMLGIHIESLEYFQ